MLGKLKKNSREVLEGFEKCSRMICMMKLESLLMGAEIEQLRCSS